MLLSAKRVGMTKRLRSLTYIHSCLINSIAQVNRGQHVGSCVAEDLEVVACISCEAHKSTSPNVKIRKTYMSRAGAKVMRLTVHRQRREKERSFIRTSLRPNVSHSSFFLYFNFIFFFLARPSTSPIPQWLHFSPFGINPFPIAVL